MEMQDIPVSGAELISQPDCFPAEPEASDETIVGLLKRSTTITECPSQGLLLNFNLFCLFYSITHSAVDAVLAFSTAELGASTGSIAGFMLYISYTISAFSLAKPVLNIFGPKISVMIGLVGMLVYVTSFYLAILIPSGAAFIFPMGASLGGIGAGVLWTAQGSYYSLNADLYCREGNRNKAETVTNFAAIFAAFYLSFEAGFKLIATGVFIAERGSGDSSWKIAVFGMYTLSALASVIAFYLFTIPLMPSSGIKRRNMLIMERESCHNSLLSAALGRGVCDPETPAALSTSDDFINASSNVGSTNNSYRSSSQNINDMSSCSGATAATGSATRPGAGVFAQGDSCSIESQALSQQVSQSRRQPPIVVRWSAVKRDIYAVCLAILNNPKLLLLIPYQLCFGFSASFMNTFAGVLVYNTLGDGYIGLLSGISTIAAVALAAPYALCSNNIKGGKWLVMMFGGLCFALNGIAVVTIPTSSLGTWVYLVPFFLIHGAARGVWENTNKSVIAEYFAASESLRDAAFGSVYFASGFSAAIGFLLFKYLAGSGIAILNITIACLAMMAYHFSTIYHKKDVAAATAAATAGVEG